MSLPDIGHMLKTIRDGLGGLERTGVLSPLGIDTCGNGYGILDAEGKLIQEPYHYRDRELTESWTRFTVALRIGSCMSRWGITR